MRIIEPNAELWQEKSLVEQVARCARLCYAAEGGKRSARELCEMLIDRGHVSMFRHGSHYYVLSLKKQDKFPVYVITILRATPFASVSVMHDKRDRHCQTFFISSNHQYVMEHDHIFALLNDYEVDVEGFLHVAAEMNFKQPLTQLRYTVCVTTQISTTRELNRTSPNNIAEQSTRYVNFLKKLGVQIARPWWLSNTLPMWKRWIFTQMFRCEASFYWLAQKMGLAPQDAREYLPLATASRAVYTYTLYEWKQIFRLRITGETGRPHPNAYQAACLIRDAILPKAKEYGGEDTDIMPKPKEKKSNTIMF